MIQAAQTKPNQKSVVTADGSVSYTLTNSSKMIFLLSKVSALAQVAARSVGAGEQRVLGSCPSVEKTWKVFW